MWYQLMDPMASSISSQYLVTPCVDVEWWIRYPALSLWGCQHYWGWSYTRVTTTHARERYFIQTTASWLCEPGISCRWGVLPGSGANPLPRGFFKAKANRHSLPRRLMKARPNLRWRISQISCWTISRLKMLRMDFLARVISGACDNPLGENRCYRNRSKTHRSLSIVSPVIVPQDTMQTSNLNSTIIVHVIN